MAEVVAMVVHKGEIVTVTKNGKIKREKIDKKDFSYPRRHRKKNDKARS